MTSRDLTENVEQLQVFRSLLIIRDKAVTTLARLGERSEQWKDLIITARTHNVAAQPTTFGKRIAMFGEKPTVPTRLSKISSAITRSAASREPSAPRWTPSHYLMATHPK